MCIELEARRTEYCISHIWMWMLEGDGVVGSAARRTWVDVSAERVMLSVAIFESFIGRAKGRIALCEIENEPQLPSEQRTVKQPEELHEISVINSRF